MGIPMGVSPDGIDRDAVAADLAATIVFAPEDPFVEAAFDALGGDTGWGRPMGPLPAAPLTRAPSAGEVAGTWTDGRRWWSIEADGVRELRAPTEGLLPLGDDLDRVPVWRTGAGPVGGGYSDRALFVLVEPDLAVRITDRHVDALWRAEATVPPVRPDPDREACGTGDRGACLRALAVSAAAMAHASLVDHSAEGWGDFARLLVAATEPTLPPGTLVAPLLGAGEWVWVGRRGIAEPGWDGVLQGAAAGPGRFVSDRWCLEAEVPAGPAVVTLRAPEPCAGADRVVVSTDAHGRPMSLDLRVRDGRDSARYTDLTGALRFAGPVPVHPELPSTVVGDRVVFRGVWPDVAPVDAPLEGTWTAFDGAPGPTVTADAVDGTPRRVSGTGFTVSEAGVLVLTSRDRGVWLTRGVVPVVRGSP